MDGMTNDEQIKSDARLRQHLIGALMEIEARMGIPPHARAILPPDQRKRFRRLVDKRT